MKKFYMMLLALAAMPMVASADQVSFDFTELSLDNGAQVPRQTKETINVRFAAGANPLVPAYYDGAVRLNANQQMIIDTSKGVIESIEISTVDWLLPGTLGSDCGEWHTSSWCSNINSNKVVITNNDFMNPVNVTGVTVVYANKPAFTPESGTYYDPINVVIKGSGDVYYTISTDGTEPADPTAESTKYTGPIPLDQSASFKAISIEEGEVSDVATAEYEILEPTKVASLAEIVEVGVYELTVPMTVIYQSKSEIYVSVGGEIASLATYNCEDMPRDLENGDVIKAGTRLLVEEEWGSTNVSIIANVAIGEAVDPILPTEVTDLAALASMPVNSFVKLIKADFDADAMTVAQGNITVSVNYLDWNLYHEVDSSAPYNITGFVTEGYDGPMVGAIEMEYASAVALPVIEADYYTDYINVAEITVTGPEGATLYYTTDDTTPTTESAVVENGVVTITESCTLKVIAVKDGETSGVASSRINVIAQAEVSSFAEAWALGDGSIATFDFPITVVFCNEEYLYAYANDEYTAISLPWGFFNDENPAYNAGDVVPAGVSVEVSTRFNKSMSAVESSLAAATGTTEVPKPKEIADFSAITAADYFDYYEIEVTVTEGDWGSLNATDSEGTEILLNRSYIDAPTGKWFLQGYFSEAWDGSLVFYPFAYSESSTSAIKSAIINAGNGRIYSIMGVDCGTNADALTPGLYIIAGKKVLVK